VAIRKRQRNRVPPEPTSIVSQAVVRPNATLAELAREWLKEREQRRRQADTERLRDHVLPLLGARRLRDITAADVTDVVRRTLAKKGMNPKSAKNAYDVFSDLLGHAIARGLLPDDPRQLPADIWSEEPAEPVRFSAAEVHALIHDERLEPDQRLYNRLAFHSGLDSAAICQLRFDDWRERLAGPALRELEPALELWQTGGFESVYGRPPTAGDWLIPRRSDVTQPLTEGATFKAFRRACVALKIKTRSPRAIQNTFAVGTAPASDSEAPASGSEAPASGSEAPASGSEAPASENQDASESST
jgi:integrase